MPVELSIRRERDGDAAAIAEVHSQAFGGPGEAGLVEELRVLAAPSISLVAHVADRLVGHVLFTPVMIRDGDRSSDAFALGPVGVLPAHQRRGVGSALIRAGLDACREAAEMVVFVLGDPTYYPRFGFRSAAPLGLRFRSPEFDEAFMVTELTPGALGGRKGLVEYLAPFDAT